MGLFILMIDDPFYCTFWVIYTCFWKLLKRSQSMNAVCYTWVAEEVHKNFNGKLKHNCIQRHGMRSLCLCKLRYCTCGKAILIDFILLQTWWYIQGRCWMLTVLGLVPLVNFFLKISTNYWLVLRMFARIWILNFQSHSIDNHMCSYQIWGLENHWVFYYVVGDVWIQFKFIHDFQACYNIHLYLYIFACVVRKYYL